MFKRHRKAFRKPLPNTDPPPIRCYRLQLVLYCQWRSGDNCTSIARRDQCTGTWEKGLGRR